MRLWNASSLKVAAILVPAVVALPGPARADVQVHDKDGWSLYTTGLVAVHYQLTMGDHDPPAKRGLLVGNKLLSAGSEDPRNNTVTQSRLRSGFVGAQLGFGVNRKISDRTRVESLISINLYDVSNGRGRSLPRGVDVREAWAALVTPAGTLKFGRMFSLYASAHAPVVLLAYRYGIGHPCVLDSVGISCASAGAGPQYANFDAQFRYISPRVGGFELQVAISDPLTGPSYEMTPYPRVDADLNLDLRFGSSGRIRAMVQGVGQDVRRVVNNQMTSQQELRSARIVGGTGVAILDVGGFSLGGGAWTCSGCGTRTVLEIGADGANPVSYNSGGELRLGRGFFGNASYGVNHTALAAGGGTTFIRSTATDADPDNSGVSVIKQSLEWHVVLSHRIDTVVLTAEHMQWRNEWFFGEEQTVKFTGVGANYHW